MTVSIRMRAVGLADGSHDAPALRNTMPDTRDVWREAPQADHRDRFEDLRAGYPLDPAFMNAFLHNKMHIARTHPAHDLPNHARAMFDFARRLGSVPASRIHAPAPCGVGYGLFYTPGFKSAFGSGTELIWNAVCPVRPGGNVTTYLCSTATNRAAGGAEALVVYDGDSQFFLRVHDWAREDADRWQINVPFSALGAYLLPHSHRGQNFQTLPIWNSTIRVSADCWRNSLYLFDSSIKLWSLIYQFEYDMEDALQRDGWVGSWAPSVETFQTLYADTNPLGALGTWLRSADEEGHWSDWHSLEPDMATLRTDQVGFQQLARDSNHDWLIRS